MPSKCSSILRYAASPYQHEYSYIIDRDALRVSWSRITEAADTAKKTEMENPKNMHPLSDADAKTADVV
jgi:hypothetical protein